MADTVFAQTNDESELASEPDSSCLNCGTVLAGRYCSECGQENRPPKLDSRRWLADELRQFLSFDYNIVATLKLLVLRPGRLTAEYLAGRRARFTAPFRLYLVISAIAIALMSLFGVLELDDLLGASQPEDLAVLSTVFGVEDPLDPEFQAGFNRRLNTIFPILNLLTPVALMLVLKVLYWRRYLHEHAVFALHYSTATVLFALVIIPVQAAESALASLAVAALLGAGLFVYLFLAMRAYYGGSMRSLLLRQPILYLGLILVSQLIGGLAFLIVIWSI